MVTIIIADWAGYPLYRKKKIKKHRILCGIKRILEGMAKHHAGTDYQCILVINHDEHSHTPLWLQHIFLRKKSNTKSDYRALASQYPFVTNVIFRTNDGMDIGAYDAGLKYLHEKQYDGDVVLMNSSVAPPNGDNWLNRYKQLFHKTSNLGACGISLNSHNTCLRPPVFSPHIQSFFLYSTTQILKKIFPKGIYIKEEDTSFHDGKDALVARYEIGISQAILDAGYGIQCTSFPKFIYFKGEKWDIPEGDLRFKKNFKGPVNQV